MDAQKVTLIMDRRTLLITSMASLVAGCAAPPVALAPKYRWGQIVEFEGLAFAFNEARSTKLFTFLKNQNAQSETGFVIVDISVTNKSSEPLRFDFQPVFKLIDSAGRTYEHSQQLTLQINMGRRTGGPLDSLNPGTVSRREYVFEAPKGQYDLQVMVPSRLQMAFAGSVKKTGPYFLYDISSQL